MKPAIPLLAATVAAALSVSYALAQSAPPAPKPAPDVDLAPERTFFLKNISQPSDANEIFTAIRQLLPANIKCFLIPSEEAIIVHGTPDDDAVAERLIAELDRPRKTYHLTFTVTEMDGTKLIGTQHFAMVAVAGQMTTMKEGSRVPVPALSGNGIATTADSPMTQYTYLDVGMTFEATLEESVNGARLKSRVEDSGFQEDKSGSARPGQPAVIRNMSLEGASFLTPGKPLMLGSLDIPDSTRRLDIQVVMEPLP
jgi:hypothetical protein